MGRNFNANSTVPAHGAKVVTPNDATIFPTTRALYVGVTGNVTVRMADDEPGDGSVGSTFVTFNSVPAGFVLPIQCDMVRSTGTTASSIVALY